MIKVNEAGDNCLLVYWGEGKGGGEWTSIVKWGGGEARKSKIRTMLKSLSQGVNGVKRSHLSKSWRLVRQHPVELDGGKWKKTFLGERFTTG